MTTPEPGTPTSCGRQRGRMRDGLVHHYFDIDPDILWNTVTVEMPKLIEQLRNER